MADEASSPPLAAGDDAAGGREAGVVITRRQAQFSMWAAYLLLDVLVLNLLVEFVPSIVIDSFVISIVTAVLLRLLLGVTISLEHRIAAATRSSRSRGARVGGRLAMLLVLFGSKFVILEVVDIVFGSHVDLGGVLEIVAIAALLMGTELGLRLVFVWLGRGGATPAAS